MCVTKMSATFKGLLKGLRYIAQIFESKEPEMQIGLPTDVKHVSHIGWDGGSASPPSWMNGFKSVQELTHEPSNSVVEAKNPAKKLAAEAAQFSKNERSRQKSRHKTTTGIGSPLNSPKRTTDGTKQSRPYGSENTTFDSPRGNKKSNLSVESSSHDPAGIPKQTRRRKPKQQSSCDATTKSSGTESGQRMKNKQRQHLSSVLEANEDKG